MSKFISILVVLLVVSTGFWLVLKPWIVDPSWSAVNWTLWFWPLLMVVLESAVAGVAYTLLPVGPGSVAWRSAALAVIGLPYILIFGFSDLYGIGLLVLVVFHLAAMRYIKQETENRIRIDARAMVNSGLTYILFPLLIMLSFVYFSSPKVQSSAKQNHLPPSITKSVEDVTSVVADYQFKDLPAGERTQLKQQLSVEIIRQLNSLAKPYVKYFPPILAFGLFLVLQGLSFILIPLAGLVAWGIFEILLQTNFVSIEKKQVEAEILKI